MTARRQFSGEWYPDCARRTAGRIPTVGDLFGYDHAVWRVVAVESIALDEDDTELWRRWGCPKVEQWGYRPFEVAAQWIGGVKPDWLDDAKDGIGVATVRARHRVAWHVYPDGRWPQCSCCGEPMPCRAAIIDSVVAAQMEHVTRLASRLPGTCWECGEPVTRRHKTVRYAGDNLELPGGPPVVFHIRDSCRHAAVKYEEKWLAADPTRRRVLTYPYCGGTLYWHADGSDECGGGDVDCGGFLTHDHGTQAGCTHMDGGCRRGCASSYCNPKRRRRPDYRDPDLPQGRPGSTRQGYVDLSAKAGLDALMGGQDDRPTCPGDLLVHVDGSSDCIAGGRDDCWGGDTYRHERRRDCRDLKHGCPKCEITEGLV